MEQEEQVNNLEGMEAETPFSPFEGTPWNSDEEIYDYVIDKKYAEEWTWEMVKLSLVQKGLDENYADAIIQNTQEEGKEAKKIVRWSGVREIAVGLLIALVGIYFVFFNEEYELTLRGYGVWIAGSILCITYGCAKLKRRF